MKKTLIVILVCVNLALLLGLVFSPTARKAEAQVFRGGTDYLMITGHINRDWDAVYVIDLARRQLLGWRFDKGRKRLLPIRGRRLKDDFRREQEK